MAATVGLMLVQVMFDDYPDLSERKAGWGDVALYFAVKLPGMFSVILPVAMLVSVLYALGKLHRNNEITALRAAGLGVGRITRSIWVTGVLMCGVMWALNATVVPWSVEASREILERTQFRFQEKSGVSLDQVGLTKVVTFHNPDERRMWFMNRFSRYLNRGYGVMVTELDARGREVTRWQAKEAKYDAGKRGWVFFEGRETRMDPETGDVVEGASTPFVEREMPGFHEEPELMLIFDVKPSALSIFELLKIMAHVERQNPEKARVYQVRYWSVLAETVLPLIIVAITVPFAVAGVRVNPAVGVSKSIGLFLVYFILFKVASGLGGRGVIEPSLAAWVPSLGMSGVGAWLWWRMR